MTKKITTAGRALDLLIKEMKADADYADSWAANFAVTISDSSEGRVSLRLSNKIAERLMAHCFGIRRKK